jgi:hypothetical protein
MVGLLLNCWLDVPRVSRLSEARKTAAKATTTTGTRAKTADDGERQVLVDRCQHCRHVNQEEARKLSSAKFPASCGREVFAYR